MKCLSIIALLATAGAIQAHAAWVPALGSTALYQISTDVSTFQQTGITVEQTISTQDPTTKAYSIIVTIKIPGRPDSVQPGFTATPDDLAQYNKTMDTVAAQCAKPGQGKVTAAGKEYPECVLPDPSSAATTYIGDVPFRIVKAISPLQSGKTGASETVTEKVEPAISFAKSAELIKELSDNAVALGMKSNFSPVKHFQLDAMQADKQTLSMQPTKIISEIQL